MKRVGLFGGTFDPPHIGHMMIAKEVLRQLHLDEIWFIPTYEPPHKDVALSSSDDRLHMLHLIIDDEVENFSIHTIELDRKGKSYTIDTINSLQQMYPHIKFYFIIGGDQVSYLKHWKHIETLLQKVEFIGVERPGFEWGEVANIKKVTVSPIYVSSTMIRNKIKQGKRFKHLVHDKVYAYIKERQLYGYRKGSTTS